MARRKSHKSEAQRKLEKSYRQVRQNLQRNVRRMMGRGYAFSDGFIPEIPKRITQASVRRLQRLNEQRYAKAEDITGEFSTGLERLKYERHMRSVKSAQTRLQNRRSRRYKKRTPDAPVYTPPSPDYTPDFLPEDYSDFEEESFTAPDEPDYPTGGSDYDTYDDDDINTSTDIAYSNLMDLIKGFADDNETAVQALLDGIDELLAEGGSQADEVLDNIYNNYDDIEYMVKVFMSYKEGSKSYTRAYSRLFTLLRPNATAEEAQKFQSNLRY